MFAGNEPASSYLEIRGLNSNGIVARRFTPVRETDDAVQEIQRLAGPLDVFVGCAPRTSSNSGTLADIKRVWCLWADCDNPESAARLKAFQPRPSIVVRSGGANRYHAYWQLDAPLSAKAAARANRRLKKAFDADNCGDATRILRPIGTINHKHGKHGTIVECVRLELDAFSVASVVGELEDDERYMPKPRATIHERHKHGNSSGLVRTVAGAGEGNRNSALYWAGRRAADNGTLNTVRDQLADAAVDAGLSERETLATLASAERAA
jgi:hypothetical protein